VLQVLALRVHWDAKFAATLVAAGYRLTHMASGPDVLAAAFTISPEEYKEQQMHKLGKRLMKL
jgi:hypothetical protein